MSYTIDLTYVKALVSILTRRVPFRIDIQSRTHEEGPFSTTFSGYFRVFFKHKNAGRDSEHFVSTKVDLTYVTALVLLLDEGSPFLNRYSVSALT